MITSRRWEIVKLLERFTYKPGYGIKVIPDTFGVKFQMSVNLEDESTFSGQITISDQQPDEHIKYLIIDFIRGFELSVMAKSLKFDNKNII